ncbi:CHAD domain protein [Polystyrenella longa]|uniref:CHAD domain protein n=1 Tax=Polystyrenella longa TaxID=2528007 RepID=A0A518CKS2_9PLAN|nr:CHAD domain-containing protein [Polystyrenella longa]QDU79821.1 CHAD domain protein [Polystyrenella longa]
MSFNFTKTESLSAGIKRIAGEQVDAAIQDLEKSDADRQEQIHEFRKRCKKLRGLIRLVRSAYEETYEDENDWYRDRSRELSRARDTEAMIEAVEALRTSLADESSEQQEILATTLEVLRESNEQITTEWTEMEDRLEKLVPELKRARKRISDWKLDSVSWKSIRKGIKKTYSRGNKVLKKSVADPTTERLHELRKRTKYHWFHLRLLENTFPKVLEARADQVKQLSDYLGDDHDLSVLTRFILEDANRFGDVAEQERLLELIQLRRQNLQASGLQLARLLYTESPGDLTDRITDYWKVWRKN